MGPPRISVSSYVDIAMCKVVQDNSHQKLRPSGSGGSDGEELQENIPGFNGTDVNIDAPDLLKSEWTNHVHEWQRQFPDGGPPIEDSTSLKDLQFGALFLQHPIAAIALWNIMQAFYALDRVVCGTSREAWERIAEWESMQQFVYLEASGVEKRWRKSLQNLSKNTLLLRMDGIYSGIIRLEDACRELQRSLRENLKGIKLADPMLEQTTVCAARRFSMIDKYFEMYENHDGGLNVDDAFEDVKGSVDSTHDDQFERSHISSIEEVPRRFIPLRRTNSIERVKYHLVVAWVSTKRGEATVTAAVILLILLTGLNHLQGLLAMTSEP